MKNLFFVSIVLTFIISSCSIEKRYVLSGYHIQSRSVKKSTKPQKNKPQIVLSNFNKPQIDFVTKTEQDSIEKNIENENLNLVASNDFVVLSSNNYKNILPLNSKQESMVLKNKINEMSINDTCDLIILKSGDEILAKVIEIGISEIKYKKCENLNGPLLVIKKSSVFMIKYPNGAKDIITTEDINNSVKEYEKDDGIPALRILGWVIWAIGLLMILFISILLGLIISGIGILFLSLGAKKKIRN